MLVLELTEQPDKSPGSKPTPVIVNWDNVLHIEPRGDTTRIFGAGYTLQVLESFDDIRARLMGVMNVRSTDG